MVGLLWGATGMSGSGHHRSSKLETSMAGPLGGAGGKARQRPPPKLKTLMVGPLGGAGGKVRQRPPLKLKTSMVDPREVPELEIRERSAFGACPSGRGGEWL
jgi:hypothetical protein